MTLPRPARLALNCGLVAVLTISLSACGGRIFSRDSGLFGRAPVDATTAERRLQEPRRQGSRFEVREEQRRTRFETRESRRDDKNNILNLFTNNADPNITIEVNKYLWTASLDVLNFLPIESVDPFTGVIVTGYGRPPGGGRAYRATVLIQDPALDARALKLALQSQGGGAVAPETVRAVEDAILTRARQLRIQDSRL